MFWFAFSFLKMFHGRY